MIQQVLPFESTETLEQLFERVFRLLKPRTQPPAFEVAFYPYANLDSKIRLEDGHSVIRVRLSDQLRAAPESVKEALAHILLGKLYRKPTSDRFDDVYRRFVNRPDIRDTAKQVRRRRGRKRVVHPRGRVHDLDALYDALNRRFFAGALEKPHLGWSLGASHRLLGHYDPAHHAIVLSRALDRSKVPAYVVEYVLYHEMLHLKHPVEYRSERRCVHSAAFKAEERRFPEFERANRFLKTF